MLYIVATHSVFLNNQEVNGPAHTIVDYLRKKNLPVTFIRHPLNTDVHSSKITENNIENQIEHIKGPKILAYIQEIYVNCKHIFSKDEDMYFIGIDPLNALAGLLAKIIKGDELMTVYYIADYTENRFKNKLINSIYFFVDNLVCRKVDQIWCVSSRIKSKKISQGIPATNIELVPNSPQIQINDWTLTYDNNHNCILVCYLAKSIDFEAILDIIGLVSKSIIDISLTIVGDGDQRKEFENLVSERNLQSKIKFLGSLPHAQTLENMRKSFIGLAMYSGNISWNYYGDSMKAREYLAYGLPVVINDIPSTADDIRENNAGFVIYERDIENAAKFIIRCCQDNDYYVSIRNNAYLLAKKYDKNTLLDRLIKR